MFTLAFRRLPRGASNELALSIDRSQVETYAPYPKRHWQGIPNIITKPIGDIRNLTRGL
jgi:hypothetical protein